MKLQSSCVMEIMAEAEGRRINIHITSQMTVAIMWPEAQIKERKMLVEDVAADEGLADARAHEYRGTVVPWYTP